MKFSVRQVLAVVVIAVLMFTAGFYAGTQYHSPIGTRTYSPSSRDILLIQNFGPVTNSTPETHFQYQTIPNLEVRYFPQNQKDGTIEYTTCSAKYHVVVVMRGYFAELGYKYGTDYVELRCGISANNEQVSPGDTVTFQFAEQFTFDMWIIST